jgi:hypothetical protein
MNHRRRLCPIVTALLAFAFAVQQASGAGNFDVRKYGAVGDGTTMNTGAIQKTIDSAAAAGGGTVVFPPGTFLSGSITLKSGVTLQLDQGATLLGSPNRFDYSKLDFYGLILAKGQENIGIRGRGVIDGQGKLLAEQTMRLLAEGKLRDSEPENRPYASVGERPVIINFNKCKNIIVRDVTLRESACWVQEYRECTRLLIENIKVRTMAAITNDGIDIDSCSQVIVRGCDVDSEDDGICLKSGPRACEDVLIENCRVRSTCNALKFGTASSKGFKNITVRNLVIYDTYLSGIALQIVDGGSMENVNISKVRMTTTNNPIFIRLGHRNAKGAVGSIEGVTISDVTAEVPNRRKSEMNKFPAHWRHLCTTLITGSITGLPGHPVRGVTLRNVHISYGGIGEKPKPNHVLLEDLTKVPECAQNYPESKMFGVLPAWGLYCRHAEGLTFENVTLRVSGKDYRAGVIFDDVRDLKLDGFHVLSAGREPVIVLNDVRNATVRNCKVPSGAARFIDKRGDTKDINGL